MKKNSGLKFLLLVVFLCLVAVSITLVVLGDELMVLGIVLAIVNIALLITYISVYNKIVRYKSKVKESLALIDIHLKLRFDLIPNLVNTVKGYAKHEKEVFEEVTRLRNLAVNASSESEKLEYSNQLVPQMKNLIAVAEDYPKLQADKLFKNLMEQLVEVEDRIVSSRRIYDSNVGAYNTLIKTFPNNLVANIYGFEEQTMFRIDTGENICPKVSME